MACKLLNFRNRVFVSPHARMGTRDVKNYYLCAQPSLFKISKFFSEMGTGRDPSTDEEGEKQFCFNEEGSYEDFCMRDEEPSDAVEADTPGTKALITTKGIYKAILVGEVGYAPTQKILRSGLTVTMFSLGTSGMRNNRKPFEHETPEQYARRSFVQWHRISIYHFRLGKLALTSVKTGSQVYVEGNIETRVYFDPVSNTVKRLQEVAVRQNGRLIFLDQNKVRRGVFGADECDGPVHTTVESR